MRVVGLISGGKDSCYNMMQCVASGHELVALANLRPHNLTELDSYMYQSVGHEAIEYIAEAMNLPLLRIDTKGVSEQRGKDYEPKEEDDEVEDLFRLLQTVKSEHEIEAVSCGAILSDYQRVRLENVCLRLGLTPLCYLWRREQAALLHEMATCEVDAIVIKVAALGLDPQRHLGRSIRLLEPHLLAMKDKYGLNVCGEGGEYETLVLDCPLYTSRLIIDESETILHSDDPIAPVGFLKLNSIKLETKLPQLDLSGRFANLPIKDSDGYITDQAEEATENDQAETIENGASNTLPPHTETTLIISNCNIHSLDKHFAKSNDGWLYMTNLTGNIGTTDQRTALTEALDKLTSCLSENNYRPSDLVTITMYIADMGEYAALNAEYCAVLNHVNPPARACVQVPLPPDCPVQLEAIAWRKQGDMGDTGLDRHTLHVQSVSHWAPANIGPYAQAVRVGDFVQLAGQIALVPGSMRLVVGGIRHQCQLSIRHLSRLLQAINSSSDIADVVQGTCYLSDARYVDVARKMWEEKTNNSLMDYVVVSGLPRGALVEWHVWAHRHNHQFEYEETGECIDNWSISTYRRWNYENDAAAIVCHVANSSISDSEPTPAHIFAQAVTFTLTRLRQPTVAELSNSNEDSNHSVCALRVYYRYGETTAPLDEYESFLRNFDVLFSLIPARALATPSCRLSLVGTRLH